VVGVLSKRKIPDFALETFCALSSNRVHVRLETTSSIGKNKLNWEQKFNWGGQVRLGQQVRLEMTCSIGGRRVRLETISLIRNNEFDWKGKF
jgi:hypothetical protein